MSVKAGFPHPGILAEDRGKSGQVMAIQAKSMSGRVATFLVEPRQRELQRGAEQKDATINGDYRWNRGRRRRRSTLVRTADHCDGAAGWRPPAGCPRLRRGDRLVARLLRPAPAPAGYRRAAGIQRPRAQRHWRAPLGDLLGRPPRPRGRAAAGESPATPASSAASLQIRERDDARSPHEARALSSASRRASLEHDPEKWVPVFRKDHAQTKI
jgi:hypothetical protein